MRQHKLLVRQTKLRATTAPDGCCCDRHLLVHVHPLFPRYGKDLMANLEAQKPQLRKQAEQAERERRAARQQRCGEGACEGGGLAGWAARF